MIGVVVVGASFHTAPIEVRERLALTSARNRCLVARRRRTPATRTRRSPSRPATAPSCTWSAATPTRLAELGVAELRAIAGEHDLLRRRRALHAPRRARRAAPLPRRRRPRRRRQGRGRGARPGARGARAGARRAHRRADPVAAVRVGHRDRAARAQRDRRSASNAVSVGSIAAGLAEQTLGTLDGAAVLVIGAGQTAELVVTSLVARGARLRPRRQPHRRPRARRSPTGSAATAGTMDRLEHELAAADVVVSATHAPHHLVTPELVGDRSGRPLLAIDLAVPRDIDPAVRAPARRRAVRHRRAGGGRRAATARSARARPWPARRSSRPAPPSSSAG